MDREELIKICEDAVVHHTKWKNRDSYSAQKRIQSIYKGLKSGLEFVIVTKEIDKDYYSDEFTLVIQFNELRDIDIASLNNFTDELKISSRQDYFRDCDPEYKSEMFDGDGIDFDYDWLCSFMPSRKQLDLVGKGNDWY